MKTSSDFISDFLNYTYSLQDPEGNLIIKKPPVGIKMSSELKFEFIIKNDGKFEVSGISGIHKEIK